MLVRDGSNLVKYIRSTGAGTEIDPYIMLNDIYIQDQTSEPLILPLAQQLGVAALSSGATINAFTVNVNATTGAVVGGHIRILNTSNDRYYFGTILDIVGLIITLDTALDFAYVSGSEVTYSNINMAVDGSVTPIHFHLRTGSPSIPSAIDITRIIMVCECAGAVDLNKLGDIDGGVTRGMVMRKEEGGITNNLFNIKTNKDLISVGYDWTPYEATKPNDGINGFAWRLTFNGQNKMGVALRVTHDGQLGISVQDDLSSLTNLTCIVEGHVVE